MHFRAFDSSHLSLSNTVSRFDPAHFVREISLFLFKKVSRRFHHFPQDINAIFSAGVRDTVMQFAAFD
jgi:hypothetical protein